MGGIAGCEAGSRECLVVLDEEGLAEAVSYNQVDGVRRSDVTLVEMC